MSQNCSPLNENTVKSMKANKCKDTKPELTVRRALREAGYPGYRLQWKVPGRPDICYPGRRVAIFVNGCFWHRCPRCNLSLPEHNREYWQEKFERNVERDRRDKEVLESMGWTVIVVWECEVKKGLDEVIGRIVSVLERGRRTNDRGLKYPIRMGCPWKAKSKSWSSSRVWVASGRDWSRPPTGLSPCGRTSGSLAAGTSSPSIVMTGTLTRVSRSTRTSPWQRVRFQRVSTCWWADSHARTILWRLPTPKASRGKRACCGGTSAT